MSRSRRRGHGLVSAALALACGVGGACGTEPAPPPRPLAPTLAPSPGAPDAPPPAAPLPGPEEAAPGYCAPAEGAQPPASWAGPPSGPGVPVLPIDLPNALRLANAGNPTILLARARVEEAYVRVQQARTAWLPNLWLGGNPNALTSLPMFYHHDGNLQSSAGVVFPVTKNNFFLPAGAGMNFETADALFGPRIARDVNRAAAAHAQAVTNDVQLDVALAYLDLLRAYGALAITDEQLAKAEVMLRAAENAVRAKLGEPADVNRARTEVDIIRQQRIDLEARAAEVSARLAQLLMLDPTLDLRPFDALILPIALVGPVDRLDEYVAVALLNRPELAEYRALVDAALRRWRLERWRPLLPTLQVAYYAGLFNGSTSAQAAIPNGIPPTGVNNFSGREDVQGQAVWQLDNLGFGTALRIKAQRVQHDEANLALLEVQARVGAEVSTAAKAVLARERTLAAAQEAVREAELLWERLRNASFGIASERGRFRPLEPLLAERALAEARLHYLDEVIGYNQAQFRLYWAMGQPPLCALPQAAALPVSVPVLPPPSAQQPAAPGDAAKPAR
jgi:outer membrane protein TolC